MSPWSIPRPSIPGDEALDALSSERLARALERLADQVERNSERLQAHALAVARLEVKLDAALVRLDDHEGRLRRVERRVWTFSALGAAGSAALEQVATRIFLGH